MKREQSLFWTAVSKVLAVIAVTLIVALIQAPGAWAAGKYKILYNFTGGADGGTPYEGLVLDTTGNLYSTTTAGGASGNGTVFKLTKNSDGTWTESVLYSFAGGRDGAYPWSGLIFDASGSLYGETTQGGKSTECSGGCGVVFKLTPNSGGGWTESVLHRFDGKDGSAPGQGSLTFDGAGNLYGTSTGSEGPCCGTLFELVPNQDGSWKEKVLHHFTGGADGGTPQGVPAFGPGGSLYGSTGGGGYGYGVVFKLTRGAKGGWAEHVLHTFQGNEDGAYAQDGVILDAAGNVYGTAFYGWDAHGNCCWGQVYEMVRHAHGGWTKRVLHYFEGPPGDGGNTAAGVVFDTAGNLYGTTCDGGRATGVAGCANPSVGAGVVFEIMK